MLHLQRYCIAFGGFMHRYERISTVGVVTLCVWKRPIRVLMDCWSLWVFRIWVLLAIVDRAFLLDCLHVGDGVVNWYWSAPESSMRFCLSRLFVVVVRHILICFMCGCGFFIRHMVSRKYVLDAAGDLGAYAARASDFCVPFVYVRVVSHVYVVYVPF